MVAASDLPDDIESLRQLVLAQRVELASNKVHIEHRKLQIARLRRAQYGRSSEQLDEQIAQLEFALEKLELQEASLPQGLADASVSRSKPVRRALPEHLPRERHVYEPVSTCNCPRCGGALGFLGEDVSEMLEYVPEHWKVLRHVRPKYSCDSCQHIVQAAAPSRPIERSYAGPGLLAHVLVSKFADHLPLYRQSQIYARERVEIDRSTLGEWVGGSTALIEPLFAALGRYVLSGDKLHADDTPVPVLAPDTGKTKPGRLWAYVRDDRPAGSTDPPAVFFRYSPNRKAEHPFAHLRQYTGILQADGYAGFNSLYDRPEDPLVEAACMAHARRKFYNIFESTGSPAAREAIQQIAALYAIEEQVRGQLPATRRQARQERSLPLLNDLHRWLLTTVRELPRKSDLAGAIQYSLGRWEALCRFCSDGRIEIDNNSAERAIRAVALGRKNFLFAGADCGGERAAAMYSLIGTCKLNRIDPEAYLRYVLGCIADHPINRIEELLPWNIVLPAKAAQTLAA